MLSAIGIFYFKFIFDDMKTKHFSELTEKEVVGMWLRCVDSAISYAKEINMSGLSHNGCHNIYNALHDAIYNEWEKSKIAMKRESDKK